jgi:choline dehydrogenase
LRGIGKNMQDHYVARVSYPVLGAQIANERSRGLRLADEVMHWLFTGKGMLTYSPSNRRRLGQGIGGVGGPRCTMHLRAGKLKNGQIGELEETLGLTAGAWQMRPLSRGCVEAKIEPAG